MPASLVALLVVLRSLIGSRVDLQLENLAMRHQIVRASTLAEETPENNRNGLSLPKIMSDRRINELRRRHRCKVDPKSPRVLAEAQDSRFPS